MKITQKLLIGLGCVALAVSAFAALPTYKTLSGYGNSTAGASVYFPSDPNSQIRVIYVNYYSDKAGVALSMNTASTAFYETQTNSSSTATTNAINSTNGLATSATLVLEHTGTPYTATVSSYGMTGTNTLNSGQTGSATNVAFVVLSANGWNVAASVNDNIYLMGTATTIPVGVSSNVFAGDAIFVGNYGRPVQVSLAAATATNDLYSVSAHYDSASQ